MAEPASVATAAGALPRERMGGRLAPILGVGVIWLFLLVFLVYPLLRIFYDAFTDEAGVITLANVVEFAGDAFYRRSLLNSLLLGLATVATTSILGFAIAFLLVRYDFVGAEPLLVSHADPDHLAPPGGGARHHVHPGAGGHRQRAAR